MMKMLNDLRVGTKLNGGFAIVVLVLIITIGIGYLGIRWLSESMSSLYTEETVPIKNLSEVKFWLGRIRSTSLIYVEIPDNVSVSIASAQTAAGTAQSGSQAAASSGQLHCANCHVKNVNGDHHLVAGQKAGDETRCLTCHGDKTAASGHGGTSVQKTTETKAATQANCATCHADVVNSTHKLQANEKPGDANRCIACHQAIADSPLHGTGVMTEAECATCHPPDVARSQRSALQKSYQQDVANIKQSMDQYRKLDHTSDEIAELGVFDSAWKDYLAQVDLALSQVDQAKKMAAVRSLTDGDAQKSRLKVEASLDRLITALHKEADQAQKSGIQTFQNSTLLLFGVGAGGIFIAILLGLLITLSINKPMNIISEGLRNFQKGDLNRRRAASAREEIINRSDELGIAGKGLVSAESYLQEMASVASQIADGDLSVDVTPRGPQDEFGQAFERMVASLRDLIGDVADSANNLEVASAQMSQTAVSARKATKNIIESIVQVSNGIDQQSTSLKNTLSTVSQMERAISGVAAGAQDQSNSINSVTHITARINASTEQAAGNATAVTERSSEAAKAARYGSTTVEQTLAEMRNIKERVGESAIKVQEMGQRSEQISSIVETIDEIAAQTNLLALNAAIEAARAGEQGRGFAVVADEVRKLAERSSQATREVGQLVRGIQSTVTEAVNAMEMGMREVNSGVERANDAGRALAEILKATEIVNKQADEARRMTGLVSKASDELIGSIEQVSAVIEQNTASAEEMAASSTELTSTMRKIADVSEDNSSSVHAVGSGAEEIHSQMEEVEEAAMELSQMARELQAAMEKFKLA